MPIALLISSHDNIDAEIKSVKDRNRCMHRLFLIIDILISFLIISIEAFLWYMLKKYRDDGEDNGAEKI